MIGRPQSSRLIVAGGTVVSGRWRGRADVLVEDGRITAVGDVEAAGAAVLDAGGSFVLPGAVDPHAHIFGRVESDTISAVCGGTTTVLSFLPEVPGETPAEIARLMLEDEVPHSAADLGFHAVIWEPGEYRRGNLAEVADLGVTSVKLWLAYRELGIMADDAQAYAVIREAAAEGVLVQAHCENGAVLDAIREELVEEGKTALRYHPDSRPIALEAETTHRFLVLAELAGADAYVVHISGAAPLTAVADARRRGQRAFAEVCSHHLVFTDEIYETGDAVRYLLTPPLRTAADRDELWRRLADGTVDVLASDHGHYALEEKLAAGDDFTRAEYGIPGVEARLPLAFTFGVETGLLSIERVVEATAEAPARIFGLYPRKGALAPGSDADVVVWDPDFRWTIGVDSLHDGLDYTPYEGIEVRGRPRFVVAGGEVVAEDGRYLGRSRVGTFLPRTRGRPAPALV